MLNQILKVLNEEGYVEDLNIKKSNSTITAIEETDSGNKNRRDFLLYGEGLLFENEDYLRVQGLDNLKQIIKKGGENDD